MTPATSLAAGHGTPSGGSHFVAAIFSYVSACVYVQYMGLTLGSSMVPLAPAKRP